jgi:uroporphyrinogen-III decarboxylase
MFELKLQFARWSAFNLLQDLELGVPQAWHLFPDFQNYSEAAWFGCPVEYIDGQVPDTRPVFESEPEHVMQKGLPDPFGPGMGARALQYYEHFKDRATRETYLDRPIIVDPPMCGTDGPFTVACNLFGPEFICSAMLESPDRFHRLLDFITEATIHRMVAWRKLAGIPVPQDDFGFADDSIALIGTASYRDHVLPYHRKLCDALATTAPRSIHLCGDATRHFERIRNDLNVRSFDTGFPVDFGQLRRQLGPDVRIQGGPHVALMLHGSPSQIRQEVRRIMRSGVLEGRRFVLREGNNLAPHTPLQNCEAMYHAGREFGRFDAMGTTP